MAFLIPMFIKCEQFFILIPLFTVVANYVKRSDLKEVRKRNLNKQGKDNS